MPTWAFLVPEAGFSARPRCLKDEPEVPQFANPLCLLTASSNVSGSIQRSWGQSRLADPNTDARSKKARSILILTPLLWEPCLKDHHRTSRRRLRLTRGEQEMPVNGGRPPDSPWP